jgi:hypothetical protein
LMTLKLSTFSHSFCILVQQACHVAYTCSNLPNYLLSLYYSLTC